MEGEKVATCMAYTVLKVHKNKLLKLKDMDSIVHYLQVKLQKDFGYDDDVVIKAYEQCSEELRKAKMELPPPPAPEIEYPQKPFGVFVEPTKDEKIGHRKSDFSEIEKGVTDGVIKTWVVSACSDRCDIKTIIYNRREQTAAELANEAQTIEIGLCESNSQLNTGERSQSNRRNFTFKSVSHLFLAISTLFFPSECNLVAEPIME